jgi:hypothetical protein
LLRDALAATSREWPLVEFASRARTFGLTGKREVILALLVIDNGQVEHLINTCAEPLLHVLAANPIDLPALGAIPDFTVRASTSQS